MSNYITYLKKINTTVYYKFNNLYFFLNSFLFGHSSSSGWNRLNDLDDGDLEPKPNFSRPMTNLFAMCEPVTLFTTGYILSRDIVDSGTLSSASNRFKT